MDTTPVITRNGTDFEVLMNLRRNALHALLDAEKALAAMYPNGRDYIGDAVRFKAACDEHEAWAAAVHQVYVDLTNATIALRRSRP